MVHFRSFQQGQARTSSQYVSAVIIVAIVIMIIVMFVTSPQIHVLALL